MNLEYTESLREEIQKEGQRYVTESINLDISYEGYRRYLVNGERLFFEKQYYARRKAIHTVALYYCLERKQSTLNKLEELIWLICNEFSWALPAHLPVYKGSYADEAKTYIDLNASETGQMLSEIYEWFSDELSDDIKQRIRLELSTRIFQPYLTRNWWWETQTNNWSSVIASCINMSAISLLGDEPTTRAKIIKKSDECFSSFFSGYHEDGACDEGVGYWSYGFGYYCYFAEKYEQAFQDDHYLLGSKLKKIASFPFKATLANGQFVPFSDDNNGEIPSGLLSFVSKVFKVSVPKSERVSKLNFFHTYRWLDLSRNLLWSEPMTTNYTDEVTTYFQNLEWLVMKDNKESFSFAAKGGNNNEAHNHNDVGSFIIGDRRQLFLTDLGAGEYTKDYFNNNYRFTYLNTRGMGHSVPLINYQEQRPGNYAAQEVVYRSNGEEIIFELELSDMYPSASNVSFFKRKLCVDSKTSTVQLSDEMIFNEKNKQMIQQNFVSQIKPIICNHTVNWFGEENTLVLTFDHHVDSPKVITHNYQNHRGESEVVYLLQLEQNKQTENYNRVLLFSLRKN